jgi:trimethylamine--corrinoid protein Co-methyltransferase
MLRKGLPGDKYTPLNDKDVLKVHETAMRVIEEVGFEVNSTKALEIFESGGAIVDHSKHRVHISADRVQELIKKAPEKIKLCGREEKHDILLGGNHVYAGTGGTALYMYEAETGQRRLATLDDLKQITRLVHQLDNIHLFMLPTYPNEIPSAHVDVNRFFTGLDNTSKHIMGGVYTRKGVQQVIKMAGILAGSPFALRQRPIVSMVACSISPLKIDRQYGDLVIDIAKSGIPLVCPAEPLCGATSPITLAGNLVLQITDSLMGVLLSQICNPGTPVILGSVASNMDLRRFSYLGGTVEMGLLSAAGAQMAQFYKLPFYSTGGMTDSKMLDAQCGYESAITSLLNALAGANFIHDAAGLMEFALSMSLEKLVIDNEILGMVMRAVDGIKVNDDTLAYDLIKQVGPGGNFLITKHTRHFMRREHYQPSLSDRSDREEWEAKGKEPTWQKASRRVKELLARDRYSMPVDKRNRILQEIKDIVAG